MIPNHDSLARQMSETGMGMVEKFLALYEQGTYTFGEAVCYFIRLAADEAPSSFVYALPAEFMVNIAEQVAIPLQSPEDVRYRLDDGTLARSHCLGAQQWRAHLFEAAAEPAPTTPPPQQ